MSLVRSQDETFDRSGNDRRHDRHGSQGDPETSGNGQKVKRQHRAEHEQVAVGHVHDAHDAEDECEAEGDERNDETPDEAVHKQKEYRDRPFRHDRPSFGPVPAGRGPTGTEC